MSDKAEVPDKSKTSDKLLASVIVLNCLIPGKNVKDIFDVIISNTDNNQVSSLAEAIRNCRLVLFKDIDLSRLKLYKNKEYAESVIIYTLMKDNVAILDGTEWMDPENAIYNYFNVDIEFISKLKEAIKAKNSQTFTNVDAKDIKLWKVPISVDHVNLLNNLSLEDGEELLAINEIGDYWTEKLPKKHIHVIVSPPEATATSEVLKLREEVASLKKKLSKSEYEFDIIVKPKQKTNKWTVNIEQGTLISDLKDYIRELYKPLALENDGAVLKSS
ncbi:hypothetical protein GLOIN_2v811958 [Rhizophagus clarus]|uniref:Crinkler effector protein N-terminal domain-containing protein n=1 Tax=Rhizophagus clarus TaxID=94130 RepID=A0A8H3MDD9_9GLOM|nr:hypothetical protein GLOIN_2v811958 [Rhizophagus clarus]